MTPDPVDLFVGQVIALLPARGTDAGDPVRARLMRMLFPRAVGRTVDPPTGPLHPRVYSLITNGRDVGVLTVSGTEIPVRVLPLDVGTPSEATAFRITEMAGRALRVRGVAEGDSAA
ncbi:hypothetical protein ITJ43_11535 [Microbacterium sp. VKM Ac-2870]|uniref:hypothetical protein n=1 Tax=Microbacterium sp. VKM Ac-2870 TaxID=2783825 RepID=UPI00188A3D0C|nr:hypothetical protein [Microbacterium sp. VKM Ac-2870]MBF4562771.1 hypothetical protein [Microbacterium sp. VKM Ac-2870]